MNVLVTGANRGLGLEFAKQYANRGDSVIATARNPDSASDLKALADGNPNNVEIVELDVANDDQIDALAARLESETVDLLINNAGIFPRESIPSHMDREELLHCFNVNVAGQLRVTEASLPALKRSNSAVIANMSSGLGSIDDNTSGGMYAYRISKAGLNMATRSLAEDLKVEGITCLAIHPGWASTDMGGPNASITPTRAVEGLICVLDKANIEKTGRFYGWTGDQMAW